MSSIDNSLVLQKILYIIGDVLSDEKFVPFLFGININSVY